MCSRLHQTLEKLKKTATETTTLSLAQLPFFSGLMPYISPFLHHQILKKDNMPYFRYWVWFSFSSPVLWFLPHPAVLANRGTPFRSPLTRLSFPFATQDWSLQQESIFWVLSHFLLLVPLMVLLCLSCAWCFSAFNRRWPHTPRNCIKILQICPLKTLNFLKSWHLCRFTASTMSK